MERPTVFSFPCLTASAVAPTSSLSENTDPNRLVINEMSTMEIELTYFNEPSAEDAFLVELDFCLPLFMRYTRLLQVCHLWLQAVMHT